MRHSLISPTPPHLGDTGVGKSCLLLQFTDKRFQPVHDLTIGVEFGARMIKIDEKNIKLQIWDTVRLIVFRAFQCFNCQFVRNCRPDRSLFVRLRVAITVVLLVLCLFMISLDVRLLITYLAGSRRRGRTGTLTWLSCSLATRLTWMQGMACPVSDDISSLSIFVMRMCRRQVSFEEGQKFATDHRLIFLETSAKTAANVEEAFGRTASRIYANIQAGVYDVRNEAHGIKLGVQQTTSAAGGGGAPGAGAGAKSGGSGSGGKAATPSSGCC